MRPEKSGTFCTFPPKSPNPDGGDRFFGGWWKKCCGSRFGTFYRQNPKNRENRQNHHLTIFHHPPESQLFCRPLGRSQNCSNPPKTVKTLNRPKPPKNPLAPCHFWTIFGPPRKIPAEPPKRAKNDHFCTILGLSYKSGQKSGQMFGTRVLNSICQGGLAEFGKEPPEKYIV